MMISDRLVARQDEASMGLVTAGDWLDGAQRRDAWIQSRDAATNELDAKRRAALSPYALDEVHPASDLLSAAAVEVVHRVATDPGRLTRVWADKAIAELGEETYTELIGVTAIAIVVDMLDRLLGREPRVVPQSIDGQPAAVRPDDVGDVGAWVSQSVEKQMANVSRALSLVPQTQSSWRPLVTDYYSRGPEFVSLQWDRSLNRPQIELTAARTTALNECFY